MNIIKFETALMATACYTNALRLSAATSMQLDDTAEEIAPFAEGMAEHLLFTGCEGEEDCRDGSDYIDLRDSSDEVIANHVLTYINDILNRDDESDEE